jgi:hypothetical protein
LNPILSSDNNLNSNSANTSKSSSPQPPLNRNLNNDDETSHTLMHDKNNRKLSQTSFNNNTSLLLNSVDISNNGIFIDINNKLSVSPSHNSTTTTTTTTTTTLTKGSKLKNFSKKILKRVNSNNPTFMNKNMNKQNKISQDQDENNNNNNRRNSSGSIELLFDPNSHIINDDHSSKYQQHQDNNSISGRRSNGNSRLKQQKTLNSSIDIKEFERKLINLPTFTISDEYSRSLFPNSNSTTSFAATGGGGGVGEASSVSTEIVCFKNHSDLIQLPTELRNSKSDLIKINNIDLMKKKTTKTTITTTTTTTIMKTAESIPFIVTSPPSPLPLPPPPPSTARRITNTNNNYGSSGRSRSASIVFISNNLINNRKTNSNSKINYSRRKSDFSTNEIINHLAKKNSMSDKQLNHIKKCKIIIENDSNSNTIVNPNGSLNSVKVRSSARSLSAIPYLFKQQLVEQEELKRRNSSCMTNNMKSDSPNVVNKAIKSLKNILRSHDNIDNKSRNSLGPVVSQQTKGGISNSYTEMPTYLSNKNITNTNNTTTATNNNDLLDTPPNLIRRVRSNSASFFTQVRNSISLGASSGIHPDGVSSIKNEKPKGFKLFQSNEKLKKTNKSNNDL